MCSLHVSVLHIDKILLTLQLFFTIELSHFITDKHYCTIAAYNKLKSTCYCNNVLYTNKSQRLVQCSLSWKM